MNITLQYFDGCPNWMTADERLQLLATDHPDIVVRCQVVDTIEAAERAGFPGSPTILIDGIDPFGDASAPAALACRMYMTDDGPAGAPSLAQLRNAIG
ncbi:thioredoxin family protein [Arthrobacter cheniae]|uniref:Thioredoxin family protein n=1 Tax=Arthrobacter cheniae TaxID=1258888 RepID=A0A3A5LX58_9MICC|nr:thioredoxin family protein [Arthrobacter cheniae]RJT75438.1 thioredoxin family protein [Arthrobacter cheniae]